MLQQNVFLIDKNQNELGKSVNLTNSAIIIKNANYQKSCNHSSISKVWSIAKLRNLVLFLALSFLEVDFMNVFAAVCRNCCLMFVIPCLCGGKNGGHSHSKTRAGVGRATEVHATKREWMQFFCWF
uniref:(northern house mosquito) hypothetical protein n=1 Tax=Culex pipiens TaxID=7175 RepID=A0A8D8NIQ8_CULPI